MRNNFRKFFPLFILVILLWLPRSASFSQSYDAAETFYIGAGSQIAEHGWKADITDYSNWVVNPIFTSVILGIGYRIFGENPLVSRLTIFLLPSAICFFLYLYLYQKNSTFLAFNTVLFIIVNPVFIVYSRYVGSDPLFFALISTSLVLLLYKSDLNKQIISSVLLGLSLATKYLTVFLFPVPLIYSLLIAGISRKLFIAPLFYAVRFSLRYFGMVIVVSAPFLLFSFIKFRGFVSHDTELLLVPSISLFVPRFFAYLMWIGIFIGPSFLFIIIDTWRKIGKIQFIVMIISLVILTTIVHLSFSISSLHTYGGSVGEMNLLGLEIYFKEIKTYLHIGLFFVLLIAEIFVVSITLDMVHLRDQKMVGLFCWIVGTILLMSFLMDAQRYLLAVLTPLSIYMAMITERIYSSGMKSFIRWLLVIHTTIFLFIGSFLLGLASWTYSILKGFNWLGLH